MRFLIVLLIATSLSIPILSHAASGGLAISGKVYTYAEAPTILAQSADTRISHQKTTKSKLRILAVSIKQYQSKLKTAEKKNNQNLAKVYREAITLLQTKMQSIASSVSGSGTFQSSSGNTLSQIYVPTQSPGVNGNTSTTVTNGNVTNNGGYQNSPNDTTIQTGVNGTTAQQESFAIRQEVNSIYNGNNGANQSKSFFINFITEQYGTNTYAVQYANTLTFNQP